ncbi:tetratricopeptide repeat protein [Lysobacter terrae]
MAALVLGFVLWPLWRGNRAVAAAAVASIAIVAGLLYALVGTPRALDASQQQAPATLDDAIAQLKSELERNPNQPEGWRLLARAQAEMGHAAQARDTYAQAVKLAPDEPDLLAEAAEARALADPQRRFDDQAVAMLRHALEKQPMHQRARWFLGIALRQAQQPAEAAKTWEPLLAVVGADTAGSLLEQINAARAEAGMAPLSAPAVEKAPTLLRVTVELAPEFQKQLGANDALFVIARQAGGPPMPVAVKRVPASGFPLTVELGDGDSPMPTMKLSQVGSVEILARISRQGTANRAAGDLESAAQPAKAQAGAAYTLRIDRVVQ